MNPLLLFTLALALIFSPSSVRAEDRFHIDVPYDEGRVLSGERYVLFTHPTSGYDTEGRAAAGIRAVNAWASKESVPQVLLFTGDMNSPDYYISSHDVNLTVASGAGQHQLSFPRAREVVSVGGNLSLCLCESLRDAIDNGGTNPLRLTLVTDAIYDNLVSVRDSAGVAPELTQFPLSGSVSLEDLRLKMTTTHFLALIKERILKDGILCPYQGRKLDISGLTFEMRVGNQNLTVGSGPRKIILDFIRSKDLTGAKAITSAPENSISAASAL